VLHFLKKAVDDASADQRGATWQRAKRLDQPLVKSASKAA
jgi:hypothetical protein